MSDEAALLAAIAAHPEEDTPRLMYADWLDEHGQPIRAEFIRVQIEKAGCPSDKAESAARFNELTKRESELQRDHLAALLGPVTSIQQKVQVAFKRGFPSLSVRAGVFVKHASLFAQIQAPELIVTHGADNWYDLITHPHLPLVTHLCLSSWASERDGWSLASSIVGRLGELGERNKLRMLSFAGCGVGDDGLARLAEYASVWQLEELDLSDNDIFYSGLESLLESSIPRTLRRMNLSNNPITPQGANLIASRWPTNDVLQHLRLLGTHFEKVDCKVLYARFGARVRM